MLLLVCAAQGQSVSHQPPSQYVPTTRSVPQGKPNPIPCGFVRVDSKARSALCAPSDEAWVKTVLATVPPTTQPRDSVRSLASRLAARSDPLRHLLVRQLALSNSQAAQDFLDHPLKKLAADLTAAHIQIVYLVLTHDTLKSLVTGGWGGDQFHYNRAADKVIFDGEVVVTLDGSGGESLVPAIYHEEDSPAARSQSFSDAVARTESGVEAMIARQGQTVLETLIGEFVLREGLLALKLDHDQDWFDAGVVGVMSAESVALLTDRPQGDLIAALAAPSRFNPVAFDSIDLAHPTPRDQLRPQLADAYADAYRRRSVKVIADWLAAAGPDALPKTIVAIRAGKPQDNTSLLAIIQKTTGIDLTPKLAPASQ
ncbi:MAG: hypothetical protein JO353_06790 [Phycisphaerae bacterium]|nr:hypothetical protein [Phycisphaerae bacterium]